MCYSVLRIETHDGDKFRVDCETKEIEDREIENRKNAHPGVKRILIFRHHLTVSLTTQWSETAARRPTLPGPDPVSGDANIGNTVSR